MYIIRGRTMFNLWTCHCQTSTLNAPKPEYLINVRGDLFASDLTAAILVLKVRKW